MYLRQQGELRGNGCNVVRSRGSTGLRGVAQGPAPKSRSSIMESGGAVDFPRRGEREASRSKKMMRFAPPAVIVSTDRLKICVKGRAPSACAQATACESGIVAGGAW